MNVPKVKTAVIGCGMISNIYIRNLKKMFYIIDLVAVCDVFAAAAEEKTKTFGVEKVMTVEEIAQDPEIELVINLTGPGVHYQIIKQMLEASKNVFTEKIFTTDLEQSKELVRLADEKGLYLGVAPDTVLGAGIQTAKKIIESGLIGEITSVQATINRNQLMNSEVFRVLRGASGQLPYDLGIYYIATLLAVVGPVKEISAFGNPAPLHEPELLTINGDLDPWQIPGSNVLTAALRFENGALGTVHFDGNTISAEQHAITVFGTEGILKIGDPNFFGSEVKLIRGECVVPFTHGFDGKNRVEDSQWFDAYGHRGIGAAELAWALRTGRKQIRCSKEFGLHCQEVLFGMDKSVETGAVYKMESGFVMKGLESGHYDTVSNGFATGSAEKSLVK